MVDLLALLLLVSLWSLIWFRWWWNSWTAVAVLLFLLFLLLVTYPGALSMEWLGFSCEKLKYGQPLLPWSTAPHLTLMTHCVCVLHAHMLCVQPVYVGAHAWDLSCWEDQLGWTLFISTLHNLFANLPSGFATWLNTLIIVYVCRYQVLIRMNSRSSGSKDSWRSHCSLGHINNL
jgi:hypothetical protein